MKQIDIVRNVFRQTDDATLAAFLASAEKWVGENLSRLNSRDADVVGMSEMIAAAHEQSTARARARRADGM